MSVIHSFPKVRFDFGAIQSLGEELAALDVDRPLIITDPGVINSGVFEMVRKALPGKFIVKMAATVSSP
jgi:alcohol dehydrogenase class IV